MKEMESKIVYDSVTHSSSKDGSVPKDQAPTYQASTSICWPWLVINSSI